VPLAETACELMFQVIADRAEKAAVIVTTNLPYVVGKFMLRRGGDEPGMSVISLAQAIT